MINMMAVDLIEQTRANIAAAVCHPRRRARRAAVVAYSAELLPELRSSRPSCAKTSTTTTRCCA
jgi:hypothetical protein